MLEIQTFNQQAGGNVLYKALSHPLAADALERLFTRLRHGGSFILYDPEGIADPLYALYPEAPRPAGVYVHDVLAVGRPRAGVPTQPLTALKRADVAQVLVAAFDAARIVDRIASLLPEPSSVSVSFFGGVAVLAGTVDRLATKQKIESFIADDDAVERVVNKIEVEG